MSSSLATFVRLSAAVPLFVSLLAACGHEPVRRLPDDTASAPPRQAGPIVPARSVAETAAIVAVRQVGVPYRYGGSSKKGFDCSGLVQFSYGRAGKRIPRTTADQWRKLSPVSRSELRVGDVLFFRIDGRISHVGLYLGSGRFAHAPSSGREVAIAELHSDFYRRAFVRGGRPN